MGANSKRNYPKYNNISLIKKKIKAIEKKMV